MPSTTLAALELRTCQFPKAFIHVEAQLHARHVMSKTVLEENISSKVAWLICGRYVGYVVVTILFTTSARPNTRIVAPWSFSYHPNAYESPMYIKLSASIQELKTHCTDRSYKSVPTGIHLTPPPH